MTDKYITVYQKGDIHIVDMFQKNVLTTKKEITVDKGFIDDICQEIKKITLLANRIPYEANPEEICSHLVLNLKNTGKLLFKNLFPDDIQKNLRESEGTDMYLRLDEKVLHIPWELCYDGQEFLSLKYRIGRQVLTENKTLTSFKELKRDKLSMLIIIDPSETLRYAQKEAEILYSLLENQTQTDIDVELLGGRYANKFRILKEIADKDFVHFIGHSIYNENQIEKSGWILKDGIITSDEISKMDNPPVVVFSNSCQSVATASHDGYLFDERSLGIGGGFMIAGTRNFIGPLWIIHDEKSVNFAVDFYTSFINGKPIGQALNDAKLKVINTDGLCNLLWASYVLYGDPLVSLCSGSQEKTERKKESIYNENLLLKPSKATPVQKVKSILFFLIVIILIGYISWIKWFSVNNSHLDSFFNNPKNTSLIQLYNYAYKIYNNGNVEAATELFKEIIEDKNNHIGLGYDGLAAIYFEKGNTRTAKEILKRGLTKSSGNIMSHIIYGDILFTEGKRDKATTEYFQALQQKDALTWQKAKAYNALGISLFKNSETRSAIVYFQKSLSAEPENRDAFFNLGVLAWREGKKVEALSYFKKVIELNPSDKLADLYIELIKHQPQANDIENYVKTALILPFFFDGGYLRRIGAGEVIAWIIGKRLEKTGKLKRIDRFIVKSGREFGEIGFHKLSDSIAAINIAKIEKADYVIYGSYSLFVDTVEADIRVVNVNTAEIVTVEHIRTTGERKINKLAEIFVKNFISKLGNIKE